VTDEQPKQKTIVTVISKAAADPKQGGGNACLVVIYGMELGKRYALDRPHIILGRSSKCDVQVDQEAVSRNHAKIITTGKTIILRDLGSTNGTYVNDELIDEYVLRDGDLMKVGRTIFKFLSGNNIEAAYHEEIYRLTTVDGLTQIYNKRYFLETLEREISRAHRYRRALSVAVFDVDQLSAINDSFGHLAGDHCLKQLASVLKARIRREDIMARYGGEEFAVLLPEIDAPGALQFAEKVRKIVEKTPFKFEDTKISLTISVGVTTLGPELMDPQVFMASAEARLSQAKDSGRNRVVG
jgi:diguanylate cyclase (GGDEF)-like protein